MKIQNMVKGMVENTVKDILGDLIRKIDAQNLKLDDFLRNNECKCEYKDTDTESEYGVDWGYSPKDYYLRTEFLKELLDDGWICERYASDVVADNIRVKSFEYFLKFKGIKATDEYLQQVKRLYKWAILRGITHITEEDLDTFQHEYGDKKHSVRHSTINLFREYLEKTPYHDGYLLCDEDEVNIEIYDNNVIWE